MLQGSTAYFWNRWFGRWFSRHVNSSNWGSLLCVLLWRRNARILYPPKKSFNVLFFNSSLDSEICDQGMKTDFAFCAEKERGGGGECQDRGTINWRNSFFNWSRFL